MARELKSEKSESLAARLKPDICAPLVEQDKDARRNVVPSDTSSHNCSRTTSTMKVYSGSYNQLADQGYLDAGSSSYKGSQSDDSSHLYYLPAYNHYPAETYMCVDDGHQPYYSSSGYLQNASVYGSETIPHYYWNTAQVSDAMHGTAAVRGGAKLSLSSDISANTNGSDDPMKRYNFLDGKSSNLPRTTKLPQYAASSEFYESLLYDQSLRTLHQLGSSYLLTGDLQKFKPYGKWSSFTGSKQGGYFAHDVSLNYKRENARMWSGNNRFTLSKKSNIHGELEATTDLTRGPRRHCKNITLGSSTGKEQMGLSKKAYQYNIEEFQTEYDNAKFYVIKSYNEDNIHKSIKYDVWSSTPDGNKKLDAAFRDKMAKTSEVGIEYPIFLFFSVNGSGQFVGMAEMVGPVDFDNNLDFWELNKWNGFFPVKWHIIKDIPNAQLRHIILDNNDNRPVTFTRDTQEIGLKQGIEMLKIFKTFAEETSLLEDFNFYENREQSLEAKRNTAPQTEIHGNRDTPKLKKECKRIIDEESGASNGLSDSTSSLINLAKSLSLNSTLYCKQ